MKNVLVRSVAPPPSDPAVTVEQTDDHDPPGQPDGEYHEQFERECADEIWGSEADERIDGPDRPGESSGEHRMVEGDGPIVRPELDPICEASRRPRRRVPSSRRAQRALDHGESAHPFP